MRRNHLFLMTALPGLLGACTRIGGAPPPPGPVDDAPSAVERPRASEAADAAGTHLRVGERAVEIALGSLGAPYVWGGDGSDGFDCSGLIQYAYGQLGIRVPRVSRDQIRAGSPVEPDPEQLRPGDVLGFADAPSGRARHVGLYIGDGRFIHSSTSGVRISRLDSAYWRARLVGARRIAG